MVARGETPEAQKRALLLHCAGMPVQDIFEALPNKGLTMMMQFVPLKFTSDRS